jgi:hypothetical protein
MLTLIGQTLLESGIKNVFVKGNVYMRNRAIASFKVRTDVLLESLGLICACISSTKLSGHFD